MSFKNWSSRPVCRQQKILDRLSRELPTAVDKYTPDGRLPAPTGGIALATVEERHGHHLDDHHRLHRRRIAKFIMPGDNEPSGFILTTILGIVGAFVATYLGQSLGWYRPGEGAGLVGAVVGAIIVLFVYGLIAGRSRRAI